MAELVYAFDLKSNGETRTGSSPVSATKFVLNSPICAFFALVYLVDVSSGETRI